MDEAELMMALSRASTPEEKDRINRQIERLVLAEAAEIEAEKYEWMENHWDEN